MTGLGEMGIPPHVIELAINHAGGSRAGVAGTYNKSELLPERRAALERWAYPRRRVGQRHASEERGGAHGQAAMNRKPWLRPGLTLDERIAIGLADVMRRVKPEDHPSFDSMFKHRWKHVEVCRNRVNGHIRWIAAIELDPATPLQKRNAILDAAKKVREAKSALTMVPWPLTKQQDKASTLERIADEIEKAADRSPTSTVVVPLKRRPIALARPPVSNAHSTSSSTGEETFPSQQQRARRSSPLLEPCSR